MTKNKDLEPQNKLVVFQSKDIRRIWHNKEWYYSVVNIIAALTDSPTPRQYWGKVKDREFVKLGQSKRQRIRQTPVVPNLGTTEITIKRWEKLRR